MYQMLQSAASRLSLHMPGAQGAAPFGGFDPYLLDTTELPVTDDLYRPGGAIAQAQALAAHSAGAAHTLLLHGGSTAGMHAMLLYATRRGDQVILPRNVHISAIHFCALYGLTPIFAQPSYTPQGRPYTTLASYVQAMDAHPAAKAVLAVRPDFYGAMTDLAGLCREAHGRGMLALCDEAHGAHFNWDSAHRNAGACGADLFVQSAHKTLPALTAGAWLHGARGVDADRLLRLLRMVQTSSPSFVNMLSLDDARAWMDEYGPEACRRMGEATEAFRQRAALLGYGDGQADFPEGMERDRLRLVLSAPQGGYALERQLSARGLDVEMCDRHSAVCILSLMDGEQRLERLYEALRSLSPESAAPQPAACPNPPAHQPAAQPNPPAPPPATLPNPPGTPSAAPPGLPPRAMPLGEAAFAPWEAVPLARCAGRISAVQAGMYPPGVALLTAGERITPEMAEYLRQLPQEHLFGGNADGSINCVKEHTHEQLSL